MTRHAFMFAGVLLASLLTGCGGGGDHSVAPPPPVIPSLSAIAPSNTTAGAATITLSVYGSNFSQNGAQVLWNGTQLTSSLVSTTVLTATIPAANLTSVGNAQVSVVNFGGNTRSE
jgi:IPT/TIG domain